MQVVAMVFKMTDNLHLPHVPQAERMVRLEKSSFEFQLLQINVSPGDIIVYKEFVWLTGCPQGTYS